MCPGIFTIGSERCQCRSFGGRHRGLSVEPAHMETEGITRGKHSKRLTIIWVDGDRLLQQCLRDNIVLSGHSPVMRQRPHHEIPGIHAVWWLALSANAFASIEL